MEQKYNAGITSYALWFKEFSKCLELQREGLSAAEIKAASDDENVFQLPTADRARRASRNLTKRMTALPDNIKKIYPTLDITNQKLVALLSMMLTNRLLNEFVDEVYHNEVILGDQVLEERELSAFITKKQIESDQISKWSDETTRRVKTSLKTILRDAGLLEREGTVDKVLQPFMDLRLKKLMAQDNLNKELTALKGIF